MISLRYHVVSIATVFLALAVGVVLGSGRPRSCSRWARSCPRRNRQPGGRPARRVLVAREGQLPVSRDDADSVLTGLTSTGVVHPGQAPGPANLVLVLTGGARSGVDAADSAAVYARLAAQVDLAGGGAVLAGAEGSADATGAVGVARADPQVVARLSTVDDVQDGSGRVAAVLALHGQLDGRAGSYGTGAGARTERSLRSSPR